MGKDRQERKQHKSGKVDADRDQALHYGGATKLQQDSDVDAKNNSR